MISDKPHWDDIEKEKMVNVTYFYEDGKPFNGTHLTNHIKSMNILTNFSDERLLYLETIKIYSII